MHSLQCCDAHPLAALGAVGKMHGFEIDLTDSHQIWSPIAGLIVMHATTLYPFALSFSFSAQ